MPIKVFSSGADFVAIYQIEFRHTFLKSGKRLAKGSLFGIADSPQLRIFSFGDFLFKNVFHEISHFVEAVGSPGPRLGGTFYLPATIHRPPPAALRPSWGEQSENRRRPAEPLRAARGGCA